MGSSGLRRRGRWPRWLRWPRAGLVAAALRAAEAPESTALSPWYCPPPEPRARERLREFRFGYAPLYLEDTIVPLTTRVLTALWREPSVSVNYTRPAQAMLALVEAVRLVVCSVRFQLTYDRADLVVMQAELCGVVAMQQRLLKDFGGVDHDICGAIFPSGDGSTMLRGLALPLHRLVSAAFPAVAPPALGNSGARFDFERFLEAHAQVAVRQHHEGVTHRWLGLSYPPIFSPGELCRGLRARMSNPFEGPDVDAALRQLEASGVPLSNFVINLGAADGACGIGDDWNADPANCLTARGAAALLVEGDARFRPELAAAFGGRSDVQMELRFLALENVTSLFRERVTSLPFASASPDLLKVDVDHADCLFLEEALRAVHPKLVHLEYNPLVPPPLDYAQRYQSDLLDVLLPARPKPRLAHSGSDASDLSGASAIAADTRDEGGEARALGMELVGCSLTGFLSRAPGYALVSAGHEEALLVRRDLQPRLGVGPPPAEWDTWLRNGLCHPARGQMPGIIAWGFDFRVLADGRFSPEQRLGLLDDVLREHGASQYSLRLSWPEP